MQCADCTNFCEGVDGVFDNVIYRNGKVITASAEVFGNEGYDTLYQWEMNDGDGWKDIEGKNTKEYEFTMSPLVNGTKIRCSAIVVINDTSSCTIYSEPVTLRTGNDSNGYTVDWDSEENKVTIIPEAGATPGNIYLEVIDDEGLAYTISPSDKEGVIFDLSGITDNDFVRVYVWEDNLRAVTYPFER